MGGEEQRLGGSFLKDLSEATSSHALALALTQPSPGSPGGGGGGEGGCAAFVLHTSSTRRPSGQWDTCLWMLAGQRAGLESKATEKAQRTVAEANEQ